MNPVGPAEGRPSGFAIEGLDVPQSLVDALTVRLTDAPLWLGSMVPECVRSLRSQWNFDVRAIMAGGSTAVTCAVQTQSGDAVLKIFPTRAAAERELSAYQLWGGDAMPRLFESDMERSSLLIERITPGYSQEDVSPPSASSSANLLARLLGKPVSAITLEPLSDRVQRTIQRALVSSHAVELFVPRMCIDESIKVANSLLNDVQVESQLHGDFYPSNILFGDADGWRAVDASPCFGDPCFDAAIWCYAYGRRFPDDTSTTFADVVGLSRERIELWAGALAILNLPRRIAYKHADEQEIALTMNQIDSARLLPAWQERCLQ
jgi:streptomycin 6-kinase